MAFVDECHTQYEIIKYLIKQYNDTIIIGMSASPYSRGLGLMYNNLLVPATASELLDLDYLCPVRYYVGKHIDMKKIASRGPNAFNPGDIDRETDNDSEMLSGDIIKNWVKLGENSQTIAFSPTQNMSKKLVEKFQAEGISAEHIDCYLDTDERRDLFEAHDKGEFKILSCSRLLNTGFDSPTTRCVIDCYPIKSVTDWVQRVGRILRISEGKEYAIYLDHGDNYSRFGPAEEIVPEELSMAKKGDTHNERDLTKEKKKPKTMECPQCRQAMIMPACKACGYQLPVNDQFYDDGTDLVEATGKAANKKDSIEIKTQFYSELLCHARKKGYSKGWAANQYRSKYDVWPNKIKPYDVSETTSLVKNWVKYQAIKYRASQQQRKAS